VYRKKKFTSLILQRSQYLNAVNCLEELLEMAVVPIVNENDTISTQVRGKKYMARKK
jgi:glutamate 5-kinase